METALFVGLCVVLVAMFYGIERKIMSYVDKVDSRVAAISLNLCNPKTRGAWGEEIAKNCLDKIGLKEGIDYHVQKTTEDGKRPDFSLVVTPDLFCNMDSKFPLTNYTGLCSAKTEEEKQRYKALFLKDVKDRVKEVASKGYIDLKSGTTDFAICFIPNEQIVEFITSEDPEFLDHCISHKVVICTPWTLYSIISLFKLVNKLAFLSKNASDIIKNINQFQKEWEAYKVAETATLKKVESAYAELDTLKGVRTRQLDKSFKKLGLS